MGYELDRLREVVAERYRVQRELGHGGMATVYLAHDLKHDRAVALKVLKPEIAAALGRERFLREIALTARLDHPHILPLLDSGEADVFVYYVMPYVEGESLRDRLNREQQLPVDEALRIAREVADALGYAHNHEIVHRDIKPENILISAGHARIADFGIARAITAAAGDRLTETGLAIGTPAYMSPEQVTGSREVDGRSDVYSLGCVLYEMLAGDPPFAGSSAQGVLARKAVDPVPSLRTVRRTVPEGLERALEQALATSPADRFPTARHFARALDVEAISAPQRVTVTSRAAVIRTLAVVAVLLAGFLVWRGRSGPGTGEKEVRSIAVLPLDDLSPEDRQPYFADGMTDALIAELSRVAALDKVISRTSVMRYKGTSKPIPEIARELGVDAVVEASLVRAGGRVRVTAQLIHGANERQLWADRYERELSDILALQGDLALAIAQAVQARLTAGTEASAANRRPVEPEAYDAYLRGIYYLSRYTAEDTKRALAEFTRAVQQDSLFAGAHARVAETYVSLGYFGYPGAPPAPEAFAAANAAVTRALQLDPALPEAYVTLAKLRWMHGPDLDVSERAILRALELDPNMADAHSEHGRILAILGRYDAAIAARVRARELDPLASTRHADVAQAYWLARRYDDAIRLAQEAIALDPTAPVSYQALGGAYLEQGRYPEAVAALKHAVERSGKQHLFLATLGYAYGRAGMVADGRRILAELHQLYLAKLASPYYIALTYLGLGHRDSALTWLETTYNERWGSVAFLRAGPYWQPLQSEPRFQALLRKVGLQ